MSLLARRRAMMMAEQAEQGLPAEYQQVSYISHARAANVYLPVGPYANVNTVVLDIEKTAKSDAALIIVGKSNSSGSSIEFPCAIMNNSGLIIPSQQGYTCNPTAGTEAFSRGVYTCTKLSNATIGAYLGLLGWSGVSFAAVTKLYSAKIYNSSNKLICDGVVCYRKSDNVIGMYDLVARVFYPVKGTWTKGADVT